ncbi:hypothetical protein ACJ6WE_35015 [Streptomyces sp. MMS24-I31]|uniref:hypothetical protein n=1 Tax=Streptomyces sp. MMS24-I31 TaxID=3351563 RepID=UPI003896E5FA
MDGHPADPAALVNEIEGHLLLVAAREEARSAAVRFTARLDWLMSGQQEEVRRLYEEEHLALALASWRRTAERAGQLRHEYEEAYRGLRRRVLARAALAFAVLGCVLAGAAVLPALCPN